MGAIDSVDVARLLARFRQFWTRGAAKIESARRATEKVAPVC
jgi:hypothetical protein